MGFRICNCFLLLTVFFVLFFLSALAEKFADIFFLVDSGVNTADFQQIRNVLFRLVNQLNIGASGHHFGLAQYGQDVKVEILFSASQAKNETLGGVKRFRQRKLQPNEPRNLGSALEYVRANIFTSEAGSRADQGFEQYLVVLSGKDSDDPVYKSSRQIKAEGVTVVGVSFGASMNEMRLIATPPYIYSTISNVVPVLKGVIETKEEQTTLTGGEQVFNYNFLNNQPPTCIFINVFTAVS